MNDQFNGNTEKRCRPPYLTGHEVSEMAKDVHVVLGKRKRIGKNTKEDDMLKKQSIFWEIPYWKDLDVHHSIDVMHVEKNVYEILLRSLPNTNEKKEFCVFLKNVKVSSGYSMKVSRLISFPNLKVAPVVKSHDYHILLT
jgi:hypothetical protein